jgi:hypothetical protein
MGSHAVGLGAHAPHRPPNVELSAVLLPPALRDKLVNHGFRMTADFTGLGPTELSKGEEEKCSAHRVTCRANGTPRRTSRPACWHALLRAHNTAHSLLCALRPRSWTGPRGASPTVRCWQAPLTSMGAARVLRGLGGHRGANFKARRCRCAQGCPQRRQARAEGWEVGTRAPAGAQRPVPASAARAEPQRANWP